MIVAEQLIGRVAEQGKVVLKGVLYWVFILLISVSFPPKLFSFL